LQDYQSFSLAGAEMEVTSTGGVVSVGPVTVAEVVEEETAEETA